jgi:hypothetical protein
MKPDDSNLDARPITITIATMKITAVFALMFLARLLVVFAQETTRPMQFFRQNATWPPLIKRVTPTVLRTA